MASLKSLCELRDGLVFNSVASTLRVDALHHLAPSGASKMYEVNQPPR